MPWACSLLERLRACERSGGGASSEGSVWEWVEDLE